MKDLEEAFGLDSTKLDTDFENIYLFIGDVVEFAKDHPKWVVYPADDPGYHHSPPRIPRMGLIAANPDNEEDVKCWTIPLCKVSEGTVFRTNDIMSLEYFVTRAMGNQVERNHE